MPNKTNKHQRSQAKRANGRRRSNDNGAVARSAATGSVIPAHPDEFKDAVQGSELRQRAWSRALDLSESGWSEILVVLLPTLGGIIGAKGPGDLWEAHDFWPLTRGPLSFTATTAWMLFAATAVLAFTRHRALKRRHTRASAEASARTEELRSAQEATAAETRRLQESQAEIQRMLQTLPPTTFLRNFAEVHRLNHQAFVAALRAWYTAEDQSAPAAVDVVRQWIRVVLHGIATQISDFSRSPSGATYGANIMLYRREPKIPPDQRRLVASRVVMYDKGQTLLGLDGVLDLRTELSANTGRESSTEPDGTLSPIALPIPVQREDPDGRSRVLPGAPESFCNRRIVAYDYDKMGPRCRSSGHAFSAKTLKEVERYFSPHAAHGIRSFVSFPLSWNPAEMPKGVLNVHSTEKGVLQQPDGAADVFHLLRPSLLMLLDLIGVLPNEAKFTERRPIGTGLDTPETRPINSPSQSAAEPSIE